MISASGLRDEILADMDTELAKYDFAAGDRMPDSKPLEVISEAMESYLEANMVITYGWAAVDGDSHPDPVTSFQSSISFASFDLVYAASMTAFSTQLQALLLTGVVNHPVGFSVTLGSLLAPSSLVIAPTGTNDRGDGWLAVCTTLVNYIKTMINPTPLPGSHGSYTGATVSMVIS